MLEALLIVLLSALNRVRGNDEWMRKTRVHPQQEMGPKWLPGRPLFYVAPVYAALSNAVLPSAWAAAAFGLAYLIWGTPGWGRWFDLGRMPKDFNREGIEPSPLEVFINMISFGSDHVALFFRHFLMIVPGLLILGYSLNQVNLVAISVLFGAWVVLSYEIGWQVQENVNKRINPILIGELLTGAVWGAMLLGIANNL